MDKNKIKELINKENPIIFEVGCADGQDTADFITIFGNLKIYCFEPEPKNIKIVKSNINYEGHFLFEGVMSDTNGEVIFNRSRTDNPADLSYSGSIKKPKGVLQKWPFIKFDAVLPVNSITLDKFCKDNEIAVIDFIWADVQGAEENLIKGGKEMLDNKVRFFYTEYYNWECYEDQRSLQDLSSLLGENWELIEDFGTDALFKNKK